MGVVFLVPAGELLAALLALLLAVRVGALLGLQVGEALAQPWEVVGVGGVGGLGRVGAGGDPRVDRRPAPTLVVDVALVRSTGAVLGFVALMAVEGVGLGGQRGESLRASRRSYSAQATGSWSWARSESTALLPGVVEGVLDLGRGRRRPPVAGAVFCSSHAVRAAASSSEAGSRQSGSPYSAAGL